MSDQARAQAEKDLQKMQRELTALQEDAQQELRELQDSAAARVPAAHRADHRAGRDGEGTARRPRC